MERLLDEPLSSPSLDSGEQSEACVQHGSYIAKPIYPGAQRLTGCPTCAKQAAKLADEREAQWRAEEAAMEARATAQKAERIRARRLEISGLQGRMLSSTFENFQCTTKAQTDVLAECRSFVENLNPDGGGGLWLLGSPGTGKTHLGSAMVSHVINVARKRACIHSAREIVTMLRASWGKKADHDPWDDRWIPQATEEIVEYLGSAALLVLDEVGNSFNTDAERVQLFDVIDLRYKLCRPTVLISNLSAQDARQVLGDRAYDRLREGAKALACTWPSARSINRAPRT
ncbi:MAG: ATP-binding protein [Acidovorax sp.]